MPPARRRAAAGKGAVAARATHSVDDVVAEDPVAPIVLLLGDAELLVSRAAAAVVAAVRATTPGVEVTERSGAVLDAVEVAELLSPSLFGERRVVVVPGAEEIRVETWKVMAPFVADADPSITLVLEHAGGARGKAVLDAAQAARAPIVGCVTPTRPADLVDFVRAEVRRAGSTIAGPAAAALVEAVGTDLRELSTVATQLADDCDGTVDAAAVGAYHRGRADVSGFAVSDLAVAGRLGEATELLRWALSIGAPPVVLADALADGVRSIAKVSGLPRGNAYDQAGRVGMPPWKLERAQSQARHWSAPDLVRALQAVAALNADVKGEAVDPEYALEATVRELATMASRRR